MTTTLMMQEDTAVFKNLKNELSLDEDRGSGRVANEGGVLGLRRSCTLAQSPEVVGRERRWLTVMYIIYHTSEQELLVGGRTLEVYDAAVNTPDFTNAETKAKSPLLLEARSDGGQGNKQNLVLMETSRFSGRYEGYVRLTDENGISPDTDPANLRAQTSWGAMVRNAVNQTLDGAAVIGVESGPVQIAYKDTDGGSAKILSVSIDRVPPTVQIDTPAHESEGQDTSPNFAGSYEDDNSGLRQKTFRLYVHHEQGHYGKRRRRNPGA